MVRKGDTVRYLSEVGGGIVSRVEGKIAYVDDDGFERPIPVNELVVVIPAGHQAGSARLMFDQQAYDTGRTSHRNKPEPPVTPPPAPVPPPVEEEFEIEETDYGDAMNLVLAFEPRKIKQFDTTDFNVCLVNDSNYFLSYQILIQSSVPGEWEEFSRGEVAPNELADLRHITRDDLPGLGRMVFQAIAYKKDKSFVIKSPVNISRKLDLTKFYKYHCFHPGLYFDTPVLEVDLYHERNKNEEPPRGHKKNRPN